MQISLKLNLLTNNIYPKNNRLIYINKEKSSIIQIGLCIPINGSSLWKK